MYTRKQNSFVACSRCQMQHCLPLLCLMHLNQYFNKGSRGIIYVYGKNVTANKSSEWADGQIHCSFSAKIIVWFLVPFGWVFSLLLLSVLCWLDSNKSLIWQSLSLEAFCFCSPHFLLVSNVLTAGTWLSRQLSSLAFPAFSSSLP